MHCASVREELTALVDGALSRSEVAKVQGHLDTCTACASELVAIRRTVALERVALAEPLPELSLGFATRLGQRLAEAAEEGERSWWRAWWWKPLAVGALAAVAVLLVAAPLGGPSAVLVPLGLQAPPPKVAKEPELFTDYAIIEHLDELEHFDTVESTPLNDDATVKSKGSA
jgi:anti-sigma factor RsiW